MKTIKYTKQISDGVTQTVRLKAITAPQNLAENISEYFFYSGVIRGLREGNKLDENKLSALIAIYESKTRYFDNLLERSKNNKNRI